MSTYTVFTNNAAVVEFFKQKKELPCTVKWISAPAMEVLNAVRTLVRQGAILASNPMAGVNLPAKQAPIKKGRPALFPEKSAPAVFNPYLTVITSPPAETLDFQSLKSIDEALVIYKKNAKLRFIAHSDDAIAHFQMIDMRGFLQALMVLVKVNL
jgi:hypothetical protein